ncbi:SgcJ/EcaC family oxidoreductase [Rhodococcus sp. 077-4]|uniref:SgcJ/EcaC family oxidoreductase n=1 Tax=Rhodococcus sp. 077-4 TaxID=2789271 RepID=UPI0039F527B8
MNELIAPAHSSDELVARVAELERTQRAEDVEGFLALFDADAVWVSAAGVRLIGWQQISDFTSKVLPGAFADGSVRYDVEHIRFITDDVALTGVNQEYLDGVGQPMSPPVKGCPTYIWHRKQGQWSIVSGQNTPVPAE